MDIIGSLTPSNNGNKYILTSIDAFTGYPEIIAGPNQKAEKIAKMFVKHIISRHGCPKILVTDNGSNFVSTLMKNICKFLSINKINTTAYQPQSNALIERFHRSLKDMLYHFIDKDQRNWDDWLDFVAMAYRNSIHSAAGKSPFQSKSWERYDLTLRRNYYKLLCITYMTMYVN